MGKLKIPRWLSAASREIGCDVTTSICSTAIHYTKMSEVRISAVHRWESVLLTSHESNPSGVYRQIGLLAVVNTPHWFLEQEKIWCWLNMFMCGCRTAIHFYDNREGFGWGTEERNGGWRQENQSGGSAVELTAAVDHFTQASQSLRALPAFCLICKAASPLCLCQRLNILEQQLTLHHVFDDCLTWSEILVLNHFARQST